MFRDYLKNRKLRDSLVEVIKEAGVEDGISKATGALLCEVANKVGGLLDEKQQSVP